MQASHDAESVVFVIEALQPEDEPKGAQPGSAEDGGTGVMRGDARCRATGHSRTDTRAKEAADEPTATQAHSSAHQMSIHVGERVLPEDVLAGPTQSLSYVVRRGDQAQPDTMFSDNDGNDGDGTHCGHS